MVGCKVYVGIYVALYGWSGKFEVGVVVSEDGEFVYNVKELVLNFFCCLGKERGNLIYILKFVEDD